MKRSLCAGLVLVLMITLVFAGAPARAQRNWTVLVGGMSKGGQIAANAFFPRELEIQVGDTVTWVFEGFHNVAFFGGPPPPPIVQEAGKLYANPRVFFPVGSRTYDGSGHANSGTPPDPHAKFSYSLTFTKAGTYRYFCNLHGPMSGTIVVKDRVTGDPEATLRQARQEQARTIAAGLTALANLKPRVSGRTATLPMVGDPVVGYSIMRFSNGPITVQRGTTVTWTMEDPFEIHTVSFLGGRRPPEFVLPQPQPQGPPKLLINPVATTPTGGHRYRGGVANSGILFPPGAPGNPPSRYSLTFDRAGRYEYWCIVHVVEGMKGTIIVK